MGRKLGPFDTVGISGREYNKIVDENTALRARVARLEEHGIKLLEACECADFMGDLTEHVSGDLMSNFRRALEERCCRY